MISSCIARACLPVGAGCSASLLWALISKSPVAGASSAPIGIRRRLFLNRALGHRSVTRWRHFVNHILGHHTPANQIFGMALGLDKGSGKRGYQPAIDRYSPCVGRLGHQFDLMALVCPKGKASLKVFALGRFAVHGLDRDCSSLAASCSSRIENPQALRSSFHLSI